MAEGENGAELHAFQESLVANSEKVSRDFSRYTGRKSQKFWIDCVGGVVPRSINLPPDIMALGIDNSQVYDIEIESGLIMRGGDHVGWVFQCEEGQDSKMRLEIALKIP